MNRCLLMVAAPAVFAVVSCATYEYERGDATPAQFKSDTAVCAKLAEADQRNFGMAGEMDPTQATYNRMFDACMRASGYQRKSAP